MTSKFLSPNPSEIPSFILIYHYLIIRRLPSKVFTRRMHSSWCDCVHLWLRYMPGDNWNPIFPNKQFFVIRWTYKFVFFYEGQSVHCSEMLLICHYLCPCSEIKLVYFSWTWTTKKNIGKVFRRMIFQSKRKFLQIECCINLTILCVPIQYPSIKTTTQEIFTRMTKLNISDCFCVTKVRMRTGFRFHNVE